MNDEAGGSALMGAFVVGMFVGASAIGVFLARCNNVDPAAFDAHKIDMVIRGHAKWVTDIDGKTEWILLDTLLGP